MAIIAQASLFTWDQVESKSDLERLELVLHSLPDEALMTKLEAMRGVGRDDFPIRAMWNAIIAGVVFQHLSIESLRRELARNPSLLACCGFSLFPVNRKPRLTLIDTTSPGETLASVANFDRTGYLGVPPASAFSRFLKRLIEVNQTDDFIGTMMADLRSELMAVLPDFGQHQGYDGKGIESHSTGQVDRESKTTSDPDADWGLHEIGGVDSKTGKLWSKVKSWFGYTVHVVADTKHEIPLAIEVTPASHSEQPVLRRMIAALYQATPELASRCADFSADRGLDCAATKQLLWDEYQIRPLIDTRLLWRAEKAEPGFDLDKPVTRPLFPERCDTIVHTERGTLHCICPSSGTLRDMAFQGFEADRNALKYRCPAAAYGSTCQGQAACHKAGGVQPGDYGRIVRIDLKTADRRIFTPTPHGSPSWQRGYNRRSALERINNRIDNSFCFEQHYIRGMEKMKVRVGLAMCIMMSMALGHIKSGRPEQMRSLVQAIAPPLKKVA